MDPTVLQRKNPLAPKAEEIFLAGGCFWGSEEYIRSINGVLDTDVGYANGHTENPTYEQVCSHSTGFAETVRVAYDTDILPLAKLLQLYFKSVDPTSVNRQGGDIGNQYRTGIYYTDSGDLPAIQAEIDALQKTLNMPVAIEVKPLETYYLAEAYHQEYLKKNPGGYCHIPAALFDYAKKANR